MTRRMTVAPVKSYDKYSENEAKRNISEKAEYIRKLCFLRFKVVDVLHSG